MARTIIQHIQTDYYSLIIRSLDSNILIIEWEEVMENYQIQVREIYALRKAIENHTAQHGPIMLLVRTFNGIIVDSEIQKKLQNKQLFGGIRAVAIELRSTTHRISLNLSSQLSRKKVPIKAFSSEVNAYKWLRRKIA